MLLLLLLVPSPRNRDLCRETVRRIFIAGDFAGVVHAADGDGEYDRTLPLWWRSSSPEEDGRSLFPKTWVGWCRGAGKWYSFLLIELRCNTLRSKYVRLLSLDLP